ncbi:MAG: hypothetical protein F6K40_31465 [Okeania sp. SIO3I5]|uniref:hypothetical protein n=1 Tax=Okeania sp. SIO3I5 TaxID=2607805 RepID=UPI0013B790EB|nr:hypothetical protein [Okeania sp. SIO3I5]NEQ40507.1 hypothetical protein [Okeania sp. SIO3I5]
MRETNELKEIEKAISQLSPKDLSEFRRWFAEFDAETWDKEFETDVMTGKLDGLAQKALKHLQEGNCTDL